MRTDRTLICTGCWLRFDRAAARCATCDGALRQGREVTPPEPVARAPRPALTERWDERGAEVFGLGWLATAVVMMIAAGWYAYSGRTSVWGALYLGGIMAPMASCIVALMLTMVIRGGLVLVDAVRRMLPLQEARGLRLAPASPEEGTGVESVAGRALCVEPSRSLLDGAPCVGFRLVGRAGAAEVDDASLASFRIVTDGESVEASGEAVLELDAPGQRRVPAPSAGLRSFLRARGIPAGDRLRLVEALLRDGDRVEVTGPAVWEPVPGAGYRQSDRRLRLVGTSRAPLRVRRRGAGGP